MIKNYIALDLETTGLHPSEDRILEIGAVKVVNGEITDRYETLVNPGMAISPRIQELAGEHVAIYVAATLGLISAGRYDESFIRQEILPVVDHGSEELRREFYTHMWVCKVKNWPKIFASRLPVESDAKVKALLCKLLERGNTSDSAYVEEDEW